MSSPVIFGRFYAVLSVAVPIFGVFMQFCPSLPQKMNFCLLPDHHAFSMYDNVQLQCKFYIVFLRVGSAK